MKLSNFKLIEKKKEGFVTYSYRATVEVETGLLWWKKTETKEIRKGRYDVFWHFIDTGKFTPGFVVKDFERVWNANNEQQID